MLLMGYKKEMFLPKCNPSFTSVHCVAYLDEDISEVLPYLNTELGGGDYIPDPPSLTLRVHGKLITLHAREIFVNALNGEEDAEKILGWLQKEINEAWERRNEIEPTRERKPEPRMMDILRLLPKTNCEKCGEPTCTVFALRAAEGVKGAEDCPEMNPESRGKLESYLGRFTFDV